MNNLKPNAQRAKNALRLIWIVLIVDLIAFISGFYQLSLLQNLANGIEYSMVELTANDTREQWISIVNFIVLCISGVTFIQWFRRAYYNLHVKVNHLSHPEGWAAGSWFVPIVGLYRPYQIMRELYTETKSLLLQHGIGKHLNFSRAPLAFWWTFWIINNFVAQLMFNYTLRAETIEEFSLSTLIGLCSSVIGIILAFITIRVIKRYAAMERLLYDLREGEFLDDSMNTM